MDKVIQELKQGLGSENIPERPNVENVRFDVMHARIIDALHRFNGAPFTIQRLCELLTDPKRHYKRSDKFMRGLEKNVLVVSTVDPFGRKVVCESSKHMVNGMDVNGAFPPRDTALTVPLPPVPGWVTTSSAATTSRTQTLPSDSVTEQRLGTQASTQNPGVVSNGIGSSGLSSTVYADQGEQLSVQREEVIEETVVTMETNDVSSVASDAGEALAEGEEDEDMADDRTSSSSSSSSSSEELSTSSDSIDSNIHGNRTVAAASSSAEPSLGDHPWEGIAFDGGEDSQSTQDSQSSLSGQTECQENSAKDNPPRSPLTSTMPISPHDAGPSLITPESTVSVCVDRADSDAPANLPESSQTASPQSSKQEATFETVFPKSEEAASLPTDSIVSTSVPDSLHQSVDKSKTDLPVSDPPPMPHHQFPTSSLNPESQALLSSSSSSSGTHVESDVVNVTPPCDRLVEADSLTGSAEPLGGSAESFTESAESMVVSSSSSSNGTSSSPISTSVSDTESLEEGMPDCGQPAAYSENNAESEPPRKCLKLSDGSSAGTYYSCNESGSGEVQQMPTNPAEEESMDHVHSSADDLPLPSSPKDPIVESHFEGEVCEAGEKHDDSGIQGTSESSDSVTSGDPAEESSPACSAESVESKDANVEDAVSSIQPDVTTEARDDSSET